MNLPPLRLYLKYGCARSSQDVLDHDLRVGALCQPAVVRIFLHMASFNTDAREALIKDYMKVLCNLVRHIDVTQGDAGTRLQRDLDDAVSALKAGEFMAVPSPYEVIEEAGDEYLVIGLSDFREVVRVNQSTRPLAQERLYGVADSLANVAAACRSHIRWLDAGMPAMAAHRGYSDLVSRDRLELCDWPRTSTATLPHRVDQKEQIVKCAAYLDRAVLLVQQREKLIKRFSDSRRRRGW